MYQIHFKNGYFDIIRRFRGLCKLFTIVQSLPSESLGNYTHVLCHTFCHTTSPLLSNICRTSLVLTRKTRRFTVNQKQIGLRNYIQFSPVKFSRMNMLAKDLKIEKFVSNSLKNDNFEIIRCFRGLYKLFTALQSLLSKNRGLKAKQKQIWLQNDLQFDSVKVSAMKLLVKGLKAQKLALTSLQKWQFDMSCFRGLHELFTALQASLSESGVITKLYSSCDPFCHTSFFFSNRYRT